ncbi:C-type lectin domain family 4 member A-like [Chelmon rostratus]|uniref:C-type lectin domain family 4 member A-like n=1 Tax=Chelmon rostratus TaxID=109905 RepID=UPI001BE71DD7|nr:C-type lectin domain family 4 member A-like [Chelmon rostratus]
MEEHLNYATVTFRTDGISAHEKPNNLEIIYDEVKAREEASATDPVSPEKPNNLEIIYDEVKAREEASATDPVTPVDSERKEKCTLLHLVAAGLGIICVILVLVIVALRVHFNTVMSEQHRETTDLTEQNLQLWAEKADLQRQTDELNREKDGLRWTIGVIMEYDNFPVNTHCPQKVCKPCLDGWVLFQLSCYLFVEYQYYYYWKSWEGSRENCRQMKADLVVIESREEQEFINNHTKDYNDEHHGYWIGLSNREVMETWTWVDGSNFTVTYWRSSESGYSVSCALTLPQADPLANWHKVGCDMRNRWICETRALIRESDALSKLII